MEKEFISGGEYNSFLETTKYSDSTRFDVNRIIEIYEYLKDKKTEERSFYGEPRKIENAHLDFLRIALDRIYFSPKYNQATEDFLKSDYLSEELKKEIYDVLNGICCSEQLTALLNSERIISEFSKKEIKEIEESLCQVSNALSGNKYMEKCKEIYEMFEDYIFVIDGVGPIEYTKEKNKSELPIIMLEKSGIPSHASYYSGYGVDRRYLGENHLFSIYKKFTKFYPDKADQFVKMVRAISKLTPTEFVTNYLLFVRNGLDSDFKHNEGNFSVDGTYSETRDLVGAVSMFHMFGREQSDLDKRFEEEAEISIRRSFNQMVEEFKNNQESAQLQPIENSNSKILSKKMKQD